MNVLLIEFNFFHDEVLLPQIDFIFEETLNNDDFNLFLIINKDILTRGIFDLSIYKNLVKKIKFNSIKKRYGRKFKYLNYIYVFKTLFFIYTNKINTIVFNTIDIRNEDIEFLLKMLPDDINKIGIIHNGKLIDKFYDNYDKIYVLSELVEKSLNKNKIDYIYPILYKNKNKEHCINTNKFDICIPGNIEKNRRDYQFAVDFVIENKFFCKSNNIKFIILGNINTMDGLELKNIIYKSKIKKHFQLFDGFIAYSQFMKNIHNSDIIMPLIHDNVKSFSEYNVNKISASFSMAYSFNKPLLMHAFFEKNDEFNKFSFFYDSKNSLKNLLQTIINNKTLLQHKIYELRNEKKFSFEYQKNKYLNSL